MDRTSALSRSLDAVCKAPRVAVLYDFLQTRGGAERFTLDLRRFLPDAELWFHAASGCFSPNDLHGVNFLSRRPLSRLRETRVPRCIYGFLRARERFRSYDTLLFSGHYAPLACDIRADTTQHRVYYAHTTPLPFAYASPPALGGSQGMSAAGASILSAWLRPRFEASIRSMHRVLANSAFTAGEYARQLGINAQVLHPPCDTGAYRWRSPEPYFLSFARQEAQKRVDRIVAAFLQRSDRQLVVASDGSEHHALVRLAAGAPNIHFVRGTDPGVIRDLLERCLAVLHIPEREPFGVSAVEALAAGKPVISVAEGGLPEILTTEGCGWLLPANPTPAQIAEQIGAISRSDCEERRHACEQRAQAFGLTRFAQALGIAMQR